MGLHRPRLVIAGILWASGAACLTGCSYWRPPEAAPREHLSLAARQAARPDGEVLRFYSYPRQPVSPILERRLFRLRGSYRVWNLELPSSGDNGQPGNRVRARYYESRLAGEKRLILILPIYGKSTYPSHKVARYLTKERDAESTNVLLLLGHENLYDWRALADSRSEEEFFAEIDKTVHRIRSTVIDVRRLVDWAREQPDIDPDRIGIAGFSFSSILANLTMAVDQRIAAGVFFMGGGHIHKIFAHCEGNDIQKARRRVGRRLGWTDLQFELQLKEPLRRINPIPLAGLIGSRPALLADSMIDGVIPRESRLELRRVLGEPPRIRFLLGHREAFLSLTPLGFDYSTRKIRRFFIDHL